MKEHLKNDLIDSLKFDLPQLSSCNYIIEIINENFSELGISESKLNTKNEFIDNISFTYKSYETSGDFHGEFVINSFSNTSTTIINSKINAKSSYESPFQKAYETFKNAVFKVRFDNTGKIDAIAGYGDFQKQFSVAYQVLNKMDKPTFLKITVLGITYGPPPYYGEQNYSGRRILQGTAAGMNQRNQ